MSWRLFVAAPIPAEVRRSLGEWIDGVRKSAPEWRFVRPDRIHLTLRFLGETAPERGAAIVDSFAALDAGVTPFSLEVRGLGVFPTAARPRVAWVGLTGDIESLATLARRVETWSRESGYAAEARPFRPHLTLARCRGRAASPPWKGESKQGEPMFGRVCVDVMRIYRSHLGGGDVRYEVLAERELVAAEGR